MIYDINGNIISGSNSEVFSENMELDYEYDATTNANYTVLRVYQTKTDGTKQYPFSRIPDLNNYSYSALDVARNEKWLLTINSWGIIRDGLMIQNGVLLHNSPSVRHNGSYPLTIDSNGNLSYAESDFDGEALIAQGIVSSVSGFCPIIVDYAPFTPPTIADTAHFTQNAQRQIIGQFGNGDYCIVSCEGRNYDHSDGWTIAEAQTICQKIGLKFAYNLDGGGSVETVLGVKQINTIYENETGRKVGSFLCFNGTDHYFIPSEQ